MQYLVTAEEMQRYDRYTIDSIGIPGLVLMERAALAAQEIIHCHFTNTSLAGKKVLILAGVGNNGGDGLALARLLSEEDAKVDVWCVGKEEKATESFHRQKTILESFPVKLVNKPSRDEYDILIDALFGIGLTRDIEGDYAEAIETLNRTKGWCLALDIPSGIQADTGKVCKIAVKADHTITFGFAKRGLFFYPGCEYAGEVTVGEIGISKRAFADKKPEMFALMQETKEELLPYRNPCGNKGTFGKILLIAGSVNMAGAAVLAGKAAYRTGAGMVKVITPKENRVIIQTMLPEALLGTKESLEESLEWADIIAIGPGLGQEEAAKEMLRDVLQKSNLPVVMDADALNLLASDPTLRENLRDCGKNGRSMVLTPHPGELSRLMEKPVSVLLTNPAAYGSELAMELQSVVAAKDARTVICSPQGELCMNVSGNSGMGTAGSGDVLTGIIAGLMAQGLPAYEAACRGVRLHGLIGDSISQKNGEHSLMAGDLTEEIEENCCNQTGN